MLTTLTTFALDWTEKGRMPDAMIRFGIRRLLKQRLHSLNLDDEQALQQARELFIERMDQAQIAPLPHKANEQHYEVPPEFFTTVLGPRRKYSSCFWYDGVEDLAQAEEDALAVTAEHARLTDGQEVLELGCGWGSLTLWMAQRFPNSRITAVSNSGTQREFITALAKERELDNVRVITADMNDFSIDVQFDRVVSVEMFEHMRNYRELFSRVASWLRPGGRFFMHIFCHRQQAYEFVPLDAGDWMSEHFFSGGMMPSDQLPEHFQEQLKLIDKWRWNGTHYQKTAEAWLRNMDARKDDVLTILRRTYGEDQTTRWWVRWRMFFMACAELFGHEDGREWWVSHYLFERPVS